MPDDENPDKKKASEEELALGNDLLKVIAGIAWRMGQNAPILSRWILAGSMVAVFSVLMSLKELRAIYQGTPLILFLSLQLCAILFGCIYILGKETSAAAYDAHLKFPQYMKRFFGLMRTAEPKSLESYLENAPFKIMGQTFKESIPLMLQIGFFVSSLIPLFWRAICYLNSET
jgi:hypothetical protein